MISAEYGRRGRPFFFFFFFFLFFFFLAGIGLVRAVATRSAGLQLSLSSLSTPLLHECARLLRIARYARVSKIAAVELAGSGGLLSSSPRLSLSHTYTHTHSSLVTVIHVRGLFPFRWVFDTALQKLLLRDSGADEHGLQ